MIESSCRKVFDLSLCVSETKEDSILVSQNILSFLIGSKLLVVGTLSNFFD
jgi:hypothetical protein